VCTIGLYCYFFYYYYYYYYYYCVGLTTGRLKYSRPLCSETQRKA